ncbi:GNAT family N-acetyltransferase [Roseateles sp. LYH14W]|uniref:GNAT family N-acetyltransferase n=1 Tax=Pelomonas parva TaxID=3299032 RepID=A0ABW7F7M4_9BURK
MSAFAVRPQRASRPMLRPAHAEDAAAVSVFLQGLSATSRRLRFHGCCNPQSPALALRLCEVDGVRHQAWLAWAGQGDTAVVVGEARLVHVTDTDAAELAIMVADDWQGTGLADALMSQVMAAAAAAGVRTLYGDVLDSNARMQAFMHRHGFEADLFASGEVLRMARSPAARQARAGHGLFEAFAALFAPRPLHARVAPQRPS